MRVKQGSEVLFLAVSLVKFNSKLGEQWLPPKLGIRCSLGSIRHCYEVVYFCSRRQFSFSGVLESNSHLGDGPCAFLKIKNPPFPPPFQISEQSRHADLQTILSSQSPR